jgi:protoporphyrinogen IX oxidase
MIALVKFVHITAVVIWTAGLIALPGFYLQLGRLRASGAEIPLHDETVLRLQRAVRFTYVGIISPAAFIAVASGTLLMFQRGIVAPWFSMKLALVAGLVLAHTLTGVLLVRLFERPDAYPTWRYVAETGITLTIATAIITLTLSKATIPDELLPAALGQPGALKTLIESISPWQRP